MEQISILTEQNKEQLDYIRWNKYVQKEIEGASDRAVVLLCCSVLDAQLEKLLHFYLLDGYDKKKKELFAHNGPLGNFSAKIEMSFFCGLISKHERDTIDTMRKIRNRFAHEIELSDLEDEMVRNLCKNLTIPDMTYVPEDIPCTNDKILKFDTNPFRDEKLRTRFVETFRYVSRYLERRVVSINKRQEYHALNEIETRENEIEKIKQVIKRKNELMEEAKNIIASDAPEEIKVNARQVLKELQLDWERGITCSESQFIEYSQRILDTIKNSYGVL